MITKDEYLIKLGSVVNVAKRILCGEYVSKEERLNACRDVIELYNYENTQNGKEKNDK